jgi:dTDP-4-amino-4,6-dideoxygalactose transaminase
MAQLALLGGTPQVPDQPLRRADRAGRNRAALREALERATYEPDHLYAFRSSAVAELESAFAAALGVPYAVGLSSGTAALLTAFAVCGVGAGDEVITSPYTWPQIVSPILDRLAIPVFADIDPETYTLSAESVAANVTEHTRAILVVHQFGHPADMTAIMDVARRHGLRVIEDCAQAIGALWNDEAVGTFGDVGCFSFGLAKPVSGIEGGMLVTRHAELYERALCRTQHPARQAYDLGLEARADGIAPGSRLHPLAAVLALDDLRRLNQHFSHRDAIAARLGATLQFPAVRPPHVHSRALHAFHRFSPTFVASEAPGIERDLFVSALAAENVPICRGYVGTPIHLLPTLLERRYEPAPLDPWSLSGSDRVYRPGDCPRAERRCADEELGIDLPSQAGETWANGIVAAFDKVTSQLDALRSAFPSPARERVRVRAMR